MKYFKSFLLLAATYLLIQGLGLWIAAGGPGVGVGLVEQIKENPDQGVVQNSESPFAAAQIFAYILFGTALMLALIKYKLALFMKVLVNVAILGGLFFTLGSIISFPVLGFSFIPAGAILALLLFALRLYKPDNIMLMNVVLVCTIPGIGTWLGASIGLIPSLLLLVGLAVYDIVAVFGTKHMVTLAEGSEAQAPLMFAIPVGERTLCLGTGDLAVPLMFTSSLLRQYMLATSVSAALGGLIGLAALFVYTTQKKDVVLPALPPITAGLILGYAASLLLSV